MGFSGGGSNILKSHTHDGTVVQDGGALDFNNITQSQSAAGDVFYSDGVHLQQLTYPAVPGNEILTAATASTSPSWASPAATPLVYFSTCAFNSTGGGFSANSSRVVNLFQGNAEITAGTSRAEMDMIMDSAYTITRHRAICHNNTKDAATNIEFEDDAAIANTLVIPSSTNGEFDSGALSVSIAANSKLNWDVDTSASTAGSIVLRQAVVTCEVV